MTTRAGVTLPLRPGSTQISSRRHRGMLCPSPPVQRHFPDPSFPACDFCCPIAPLRLRSRRFPRSFVWTRKTPPLPEMPSRRDASPRRAHTIVPSCNLITPLCAADNSGRGKGAGRYPSLGAPQRSSRRPPRDSHARTVGVSCHTRILLSTTTYRSPTLSDDDSRSPSSYVRHALEQRRHPDVRAAHTPPHLRSGCFR